MPTPTPVGFESLGLGEIYKMGTSAVPKGHRQKAKTPPPHQAPTEKPTKAPLQRRQRGHARYAAKKSRAVALWATSQASPLRGEPRSGFPTSGNSGVPPLPACTRLRGITSSRAVVPPTQPIRRALCARGLGRRHHCFAVCPWRGLLPAAKAAYRHCGVTRGDACASQDGS